MTLFDWTILFSCASAAFAGFRLGFVARVLSWFGMIIGFGIANAFLPTVLREAEGMSAIGRLGVVVLLYLLGLLLGQMLGLFAGSKISATLPMGPLRTGDKVVGSVAGLIGVLVMLWLILPAAANVPGWTAQQVRTSRIAQGIYSNAPSPPNFTSSLRHLVGSGAFPQVFNDLQPALDTGPPPASIRLTTDVVARVKASTVKVEGTACRRTQDGSGFAAGPGIIVTNAHVVAGEKQTKVYDSRGEAHNATVVIYDPARDLAVLRVPTYTAAALPIREAKEGDEGAVFGHPGGQDEVAIAPAAVRRQITAVGRDLYDTETTRREVLVLAAQLAQGDSGGPLVDVNGNVVGVAFAIAPDKPATSYALDTSELKAVLNQPMDSVASTQACVLD